MLTFLKWISQILFALGGIMALFSAAYVTDPDTGKRSLKPVGWLTIITLLISLTLFAVTDLAQRKENAQKNNIQKQQIADLQQLIQQLNKLSLDRNLSGVEISFKPSAEHWSKIAEAYKKIKSPVPEVPYSDATMRAERSGDHWKIDFDPVSRPEGTIRFPQVSPNQPNSKAFDDVIREASIGLLIKWSDDVETELEPWRGTYPSAITVSHDSIAFILRPPEIMLNLNNLKANPTVMLRGRNYPNNLQFRSIDHGVMFDQTIIPKWEEKRDDSYNGKTKPYVSGPHSLQLTFKVAQ